MFDHVGLRVRDLPRALVLYRAIATPLGLAVTAEGDGYAGIGPAGQTAVTRLWLHATDQPTGIGAHVALKAPDRAAVHTFHQAALAAGGRDNGAPGLRPDYSPTYYAAFILDADGNNLEAVCFD